MRTEVRVDREWPRRVFEDSCGRQIEELDDNYNGTEEDRELDIEDDESMIFVIACEQPYDEASRRRLQREEVLFVPERNQMHDVNPSTETHPAGSSLDNNQSRIESVQNESIRDESLGDGSHQDKCYSSTRPAQKRSKLKRLVSNTQTSFEQGLSITYARVQRRFRNRFNFSQPSTR